MFTYTVHIRIALDRTGRLKITLKCSCHIRDSCDNLEKLGEIS